MFELFLNDDILFVIIMGKVGIGKILLVFVVGFFKVEDDYKYKKLLIVRLVVFMGKDIGYLLGEKEEKLRLWM